MAKIKYFCLHNQALYRMKYEAIKAVFVGEEKKMTSLFQKLNIEQLAIDNQNNISKVFWDCKSSIFIRQIEVFLCVEMYN